MSLCRHVVSIVSAACAAPLLGACDSAADAPAEVEGAITNGVGNPTVTALSASQILAVGFLADSAGHPFCSGTIIRRDAVLTAQHCVDDKQPGDLRFGIGYPGSPDALLRVTKIALADWESDLALLNLATDATAVRGLQPIPVNRDSLDGPGGLVGETVEIAGYAPVDGISRRRFAPMTVTSIFSAMTLDGNHYYGACQGDSGGPVLLADGLGHPVVGGTAIGGNISCRDEVYYSRVDLHLAWLDEQLATFTVGPSTDPGTAIDPIGCGDACHGGALPDGLVYLAPFAVLALRRRGAASR